MIPDWMRQRERSNSSSLRILVWITLALGRSAGRALLVPVCAYFLIFSPRARAASRQYLGRALGRRADIRDVFFHYYTFACVGLDRIFFLKGRDAELDVRVEGEELLRQALASRQGCLLVGAHLGSFEALRALGRDKSVPINLVMYESNARNVIAMAKAIDPALADRIIGLGSIDSMLRVADCLSRGEWIGVLADRALDRQGLVEVEFLGVPAAFPGAPFRMAALLKQPVVLMIGLYRGGNRYELHFEPLLSKADLGRRENDVVRDWVQSYARRLEHFCRVAPYNWFNFYDFWDELRRDS